MEVWTLVMMMGISWAGVGSQREAQFPDKTSCYEALAALRVTGQSQVSGEDDESNVFFCRPGGLSQ